MDTIIIGKHNSRLSDIRNAVAQGALTADGFLPVEGPKLLREAAASGLEIAAVFLREGVSLPPDLSGEMPKPMVLAPSAFRKIQDTEHSQGVVALVRLKSWTLGEVLANCNAPVVVLAGLQDPGNVGTILRVAESFGAAACLGLVGTVSLHNPKVVRASAGSVFRLPQVWDVPWDAAVAALRSAGIPLIGTSPRGPETILSWDWNHPAAVLIGNEGSGLTAEQKEACTEVLHIPHAPQVESLNSAVAAAVVLYEAFQQRGGAS